MADGIVAARDQLEAFNAKKVPEDAIVNEIRLEYDTMMTTADINMQAAAATVKTVRKEIASGLISRSPNDFS